MIPLCLLAVARSASMAEENETHELLWAMVVALLVLAVLLRWGPHWFGSAW